MENFIFMDAKQAEIVRTTIDLPIALNEKLLKSCAETKRSRHAEMIFILEKFFENEEKRIGKKKRRREMPN